jgi:hypothetical protein
MAIHKRYLVIPLATIIFLGWFTVVGYVYYNHSIIDNYKPHSLAPILIVIDIIQFIFQMIINNHIVHDILLKDYWLKQDAKNSQFNKEDKSNYITINSSIYDSFGEPELKCFAFVMHKQLVLHGIARKGFDYMLTNDQFGNSKNDLSYSNIHSAMTKTIYNFKEYYPEYSEQLFSLLKLVYKLEYFNHHEECPILSRQQLITFQKLFLLPLGLEVTKSEYKQIYCLMIELVRDAGIFSGMGFQAKEILELHNFCVLASNNPIQVHDVFVKNLAIYSDDHRRMIYLHDSLSQLIRS